jgi:3-methyl-2-oxobutanoate hydroxymethyltransferase
VPAELAEIITRKIGIPTIGIGAGAGCDGQVQVINDILGLSDYTPRHARQYAGIGKIVSDAIRQYASEVTSGAFPTGKESLALDPSVLAELEK